MSSSNSHRGLGAVLTTLVTLAMVGWPGPAAVPTAHAEELATTPATISGTSPDGLGAWTVNYQRVAGGDPALTTAINDIIDAKAMEGVQRATWDGSTKRPWTYDADGKLFFGPITVSELFTSQYNTAEPNMPMQSVAGVVCDRRSGAPITWENVFVDKRAGLSRLGDVTAETMTAAAPPDRVRDWRRQGAFAPLDINFKAWTPSPGGIDLHFPEFQFGRGLKVVTVPWAKLADLVRPEFANLTG